MRMASTVQNRVVQHQTGSDRREPTLSSNRPAKCRNMKAFYQWHSNADKDLLLQEETGVRIPFTNGIKYYFDQESNIKLF